MLRPVSTPAVNPQDLSLDYYEYTGQASFFDWKGRPVQAIIGVPITIDVGTAVPACTAAPLATC